MNCDHYSFQPPARLRRLPKSVFAFEECQRFDEPSLAIGATLWVGPVPTYWQLRRPYGISNRLSLSHLAREGLHFAHGWREDFFYLRRLARPARKLSSWTELEEGWAMMLSPHSTDEGLERAVTRSAYLEQKGYGRYVPFVDRYDRSEWVARLDD